MLSPKIKSWKTLSREPQIHQAKAVRLRSGRWGWRNRFSRKHSALPFLPVSPLWKPGMSWFTYPNLRHCYKVPLLHTYAHTHACVPLTLFSHFSPGIVLELICSSSQGRIRILSTGIVTSPVRSCREQGTRLLVFQAELPGSSPISAQYRLIRALQASNNYKYNSDFGSVREPPLRATEMIKHSLRQKTLFWYTWVRKTFTWRRHIMLAKACVMIQARYQRPQRKTITLLKRSLFGPCTCIYTRPFLPRKKM